MLNLLLLVKTLFKLKCNNTNTNKLFLTWMELQSVVFEGQFVSV